MKASVYVTLKTEVLDPQGEAVRRALGALGFSGVSNVRVGKLIELELTPSASQTGHDATTQLRAMCEKLLANPVVEDFRFELEPGT